MDLTINLALITADPIDGGYTWTLASRLGQMLREAEARYGPRDRAYTPLGVEFAADGPQLWYPGNCGNVVIQLGLGCLGEPFRAWYQLAHECVHLLAPTGARNGNVLEEGLATHFSGAYMREQFGAEWHAAMPSYLEAQRVVERLLALDVEAVKRLREVEPCISRITADQIAERYPGLGNEDAERLASPFAR